MQLSDKQILDIAEQVWRDASFSDIPLNDDAVKFARDVLAAAAPAPSLSADEADAVLGDPSIMAAVADGLESIIGNENAALAAVWVRREAQRLASADERANVDTLARVLQTAWAKAEPDHSVTLNPTSYWSTFADMARAALASAPVANERAVHEAAMRAEEWATERNVKDSPLTACAHIKGLSKLLLASIKRPPKNTNHPVFLFLLGEGPLRGVRFGDCHPDERGAYWWRKDLRAALASAPVAGEPEPYVLGNQYLTQGGDLVRLVTVANAGTSYESMACEAGIHRYTRRDFGRVTGSPHDYSDPRNIPPLYAAPQASEAATVGQALSGYAGVTVWVGNKQCTQVVPQELLQRSSVVDVLHEAFNIARAGVVK